ncbi:hypothetical protein NKI77_29760 [Mesorhizobium opportunistum]|uniref:hypothetical protein n=1 Tax=Mesorhizobium opportunistum TaxID=593909 RepID=UPI00333A774D
MPNTSEIAELSGPAASFRRLFNGSMSRRDMISGSAMLAATSAVGGVAAEAAALPMPSMSRQEKIGACIADLNALLTEETGMTWTMFMFGDEYQTVKGIPVDMPTIATDPKKYQGLHDPAGIAGPPQQHGKPQCGTWVVRREDGPNEGKVTRIPIFPT